MSKNKDVCALPMVEYTDQKGNQAEAMSVIFRKLRNDFPTRPDIAIKFYAITRTPAFIAKMESKGYTTKKGEFDYDLVLKELNIRKYLNDTSTSNINTLALQFGISDSKSKYIDFKTQYDADSKAKLINDYFETANTKGLTALTIKHGDSYNVTIVPESPTNAIIIAKQKQRQILTKHLADLYKNNFNVDLSEIIEKTRSYEVLNSVRTIDSLVKRLDNTDRLTEAEWKLLLSTQINTAKYKEFLDRVPEEYKKNPITKEELPEIDIIARCISDISYDPKLKNLEDLAMQLADNAVDTFKLHKDDFLSIAKQIEEDFKNSEEQQFVDSIEKLKEQNINILELLQTNDAKTYDRLSQLNMAALQLIKQKRDELNKHAVSDKELQMKDTLQEAYNKLTEEAVLANNYENIVVSLLLFQELFQEEKDNLANQLEELVKDDSMDFYTKALEQGQLIRTLENMVNSYQTILNTAVNIESLQMVADREKETETLIKTEAEKALNELNQLKPLIATAKKNMLKNLIIAFRGDGKPGDLDIESLIADAQKDSSLLNLWFSGKCNQQNLYASLAGELIHRKQRERDQKVAKIRNMISQAEHKLRKAGFTSDFMYTENGNIQSPYNIDTWEEARLEYIQSLKKQKLSKKEYIERLNTWDSDNSIKIINNHKGKIEYIPNDKYKTSWFDSLAPAQQEYYVTMMGPIDGQTDPDKLDWTDPAQVGIKQALDNMARDRGLHLFTPPQVPKEVIDELSDNSNKNYLWRIGLAAKKQWGRSIRAFSNSTKYLTDEERQEYTTNQEQIGDTARNVIPVLYVAKIDSDELRRDFGSCLAKYANEVYNYRTMADCLCCTEVIHEIATNEVKPHELAKRLSNIFTNVLNRLGDTNAATAIKAMIERDIYN